MIGLHWSQGHSQKLILNEKQRITRNDWCFSSAAAGAAHTAAVLFLNFDLLNVLWSRELFVLDYFGFDWFALVAGAFAIADS